MEAIRRWDLSDSLLFKLCPHPPKKYTASDFNTTSIYFESFDLFSFYSCSADVSGVETPSGWMGCTDPKVDPACSGNKCSNAEEQHFEVKSARASAVSFNVRGGQQFANSKPFTFGFGVVWGLGFGVLVCPRRRGCGWPRH